MVCIGGLQRSSLIDYPGQIAAIVFTVGCNFRCPYCHNPELINGAVELSEQEVIDFLKKRQGKLDAVVITGGEPTLQKDLIGFIKEIKSLGYLVKLDTNGTKPEIIEYLTKQNLVDYIAMDIKAPIEKYKQLTCAETDTDNILKSIELIKTSCVDYEFRTTVVKSQLSVEDLEKIADLIKGSKKYYLQSFLPTKTLDESFMYESSYLLDEFEEIKKRLETKVSSLFLR